MVKFSISEEIRRLWPDTVLGIVRYKARIAPSGEALLTAFDQTVSQLAAKYDMPDIAQLPHVQSTREAYKALGKSPTEYRCAAEAMLRRIAKGNGLYRINNCVEVNNIISVRSGYSIGSYDLKNLDGDVELLRAPDGAHYPGIGKGSVNIEHLPVLYDASGAFGNPTSDSQRAMLNEGDCEVAMVIFSFDDAAGLNPWLEQAQELLKTYCGAEILEVSTIK